MESQKNATRSVQWHQSCQRVVAEICYAVCHQITDASAAPVRGMDDNPWTIHSHVDVTDVVDRHSVASVCSGVDPFGRHPPPMAMVIVVRSMPSTTVSCALPNSAMVTV